MDLLGHIRRANLPRDITNPVILPRKHHIIQLIIDFHHVTSGHSGRGITLNAIRASGYWIVAGGAAVTSHVWNCVKCRKLRRQPEGQRMTDLPADRMDPAPPFTYSAVDFFRTFFLLRKAVSSSNVTVPCSPVSHPGPYI